MNHILHFLLIESDIEKAVFYTAGQKLKQNLIQLPRIDGAAKGGKSHMKTHHYARFGDLTGTAIQNCLPAAADGQQTAFARTLSLKIILLELLGHLPHQIILQCDTPTILTVI